MPVIEFECRNVTCESFEIRRESFLHRASGPDPACPECGGELHRLVSRFNAPWTGTLDRFDVPGHETKNDKDGGHIAYRVRSSRLGLDVNTGQPIPEPVLLKDRASQKQFCREEGLLDPTEINPNISGTKDGMLSSSESRGLKGQWV